MKWDAVVVGAGPNGLAAGIVLARAGLRVLVREARNDVGGAARTEELTLPGFKHDVASAVYPLGIGSPFFSSLPLQQHGLEWVHPDVPLAHTLDDGKAAVLYRSLDETAAGLGRDGDAYRRLVDPFVRGWPAFSRHVLDTPLRVPRSPLLMARFGVRAFRSTTALARRFATPEARALLAGNAAHSAIPLERAPSGAVGLVLMIAGHAVGWPFPRGGAGELTRALASYLESLGGTIHTGAPVEDLEEVGGARCVLLDLTPRQVLAIAEGRLPEPYRASLGAWQYGPAAFKIDWALNGAIPWEADVARRAGTVHLGGTLEEIASAEREVWQGEGPGPLPFVLLAQPTVHDGTRAPDGKHTAWAYCHVPNGWKGDATEVIEDQVERFAPGFKALVLARHTRGPADLQAWDGNLVGGDINGGALTLRQTFARPVLSRTPWATPMRDLYLCSASTPPGGGVHGMCGYHAARTALRRTFGK